MKKLFFLLAMMLTAVGAFAQEYYSAAVIAKLTVTNAPQDMGADGASYCIRAYVGDKTENTFYYEEWPQMIYGDDATPGAVSNGFMGYMFRIGTNPTGVSGESDAGKTIHFELLDQSNGVTFIYPLSTTLIFPSSDDTFGSASEPIEFEITFPEMEDYAINLSEAEKGASYELSKLLSYTEGATLPSNAEWKIGTMVLSPDGGSYEFSESEIEGIFIQDGKLYTNEVAYGVTLWYGVKGEATPVAILPDIELASTTFDVLYHATNISLNVTKMDVENTEYGVQQLNDVLMWGQNYTILPEGNTDEQRVRVRWEVENTSEEVAPLLGWSGNGFYFNREDEGGEVRVRPYFTYSGIDKVEVKIIPKDDKGNELWVTVNVTVPVKDIDINTSLYSYNNVDITANIFDANIYDRLVKMVTVSPATATNNKYHFDYDGDVLKIEEGKVTALKAGRGTIIVRSDGKTAKTMSAASGEITEGSVITKPISFRIENPATLATFADNENVPLSIDMPLSVVMIDNTWEDITYRVNNFYKLNGSTEYNVNIDLSIVSGESVERFSTPGADLDGDGAPDEDIIEYWATKTGETTFRLTLTWLDWANFENEKGVTNTRPANTSKFYEFVVDVSNEDKLKYFVLSYKEAVTGSPVTVTLVPQPEGATFTPDDINVTFELDASAYANNQTLVAAFQLWAAKALKDVKKVSATTSEIKWKFTSAVPGNVAIKVTNGKDDAATAGPEEVPVRQNGVEYNIINVGYEMAFDKDWQWRSNAWGNIGFGDVSTVFGGDALAEIRTVDYMLFNEANFGMFGSYVNAQRSLGAYECYKVKMNEESSYVMYSEIATTLNSIPKDIAYDRRSGNVTITLNSGWNWMGYPYFFNRNLNKVMSAATSSTQVTIPDQLVVVGKQNFAIYDGTTSTFKGELEYLEAGQGYLVYNPGDGFSVTFPVELMWDAEDEGFNTQSGNNVKAFGLGGRVWNYDHRRFMNNMAMVAVLDGIENPQDYSVGAFVGDECRGEGFVQDGTIFLTVHCDAGEYVNFKLYNTLTGETEDIQEGVRAQMRIGSYNSPFLLHAATTGIQTVDEAARQADTYDLTGRRAGNVQRGVTIRRMADGSVRKVIVK